jgi:serine/threonine protein kinase
MFSSAKGIQVQFTVTIPAIEPQALQFDPDLDSGSDRTEIGRGGFGIVYAGRYQNQPVAIKTLHVTTAKVVKSLYEEAAVMFRLASPYTVKLHGICSTPKVTSLVMERLMGGSLFHLLQDESQELPWALRYRLAYEIAEGLWALHSQEILHRDLKSLNVLLDEEKHAKITDFGFSKLRGQVTSMAPSGNKQSLGTLAYKSPELIEADSDSDEEEASAEKGMPYTPYSDIYAYGMILWEIATRSLPFEGLSQRKIEKRVKGENMKKSLRIVRLSLRRSSKNAGQ